MSGIVGIIDLQSGAIDEPRLETMCRAMAYWKPARLGAGDAHFEFEDDQDAGECAQSLPDGSWLVASARIDNRLLLAAKLAIHLHELDQLDDQALLARAYLRWGEDCVNELYGDWSFAVWKPQQRRLFLARDHNGNTSLYYHQGNGRIAFASSRKALLALDEPALRTIDDVYIAQMLLSHPIQQDARTVHSAIQRLPPAHTLTAAPGDLRVHQYWNPRHIALRPFKSIEEAAEGFLPVFDEAVKCRMRTKGAIAVTLSGGLDSGSIAATAARLARQSGQKLSAYTAVPCGRTAEDLSRRFGDEWWLASATAAHAKIARHRPIPAETVTPLDGLRWYLWAHDEPQHAAANAYWIMALQRTARADGCKVILTGQGGDLSISWTGAQREQPAGTFRKVARRLVRSALRRQWTQPAWTQPAWSEPAWTQPAWTRSGWMHRGASRHSAIHPDLARRTAAQTLQPRVTNREAVGALHAENGAALNIDVRDPTLDVRVLSYCLSVPDHLLVDEAGDRMLIRTAMKSRLPDMVRLNQKRGLQAADLCARLRADPYTMDACLDELEAGPASGYLDMSRLRKSWRVVNQEDDRVGFAEASEVLLRSVMVGLFVNQSL